MRGGWPVTEDQLLLALGVVSGIVAVLPIALYVLYLFLWVRKEAFSKELIVKNEAGVELGRISISAESVQTTDSRELVRLHQEILRSDHVSVEAA
jgi:hypothetical protein